MRASNKTQGRRLRRARFLLLTGSLVLGALIAELVLEALYRSSFLSPLPYGLRDELGDLNDLVTLQPDFRGASRSGILYGTNSYGFRDDAIQDDAEHILFLGDSTTFGLGIAHEETFAELVERYLQEGGRPVQSVNSATPGQGTLHQEDILKALLQDGAFNFRAVVLGFFGNDFANNHRYLEIKRQEGTLLYWFEKRLARFRTIRFAYTYYHTLRERLARREAGPRREKRSGRNATRRKGHLPRPGGEVQWDWLTEEELLDDGVFQLTVGSLRRIAEVCEANGLPLILLYLPEHASEILTGESPRYKGLLRQSLEDTGSVYLDAVDLYQSSLQDERGIPDGFYSSGKDLAHPGPLASEVIAKGLFQVISRGWQR